MGDFASGVVPGAAVKRLHVHHQSADYTFFDPVVSQGSFGIIMK